MYEEKKFKPDINWKSLIIKMVILLLIVFIICFIAFKPKKDKESISLENNLIEMKEAAIKYFKENNDLRLIGDNKKVTLKTLIKEDLIEKQKDESGNTCNKKDSYAFLTKTSNNEYILKINMECGNNKETKNYDLTPEDLIKKEDNILKEEPIIEPEDNKETSQIVVEEEQSEVKSEEPKKEIASNSTTQKNEIIKEEVKEEVTTLPSTIDNKVLRYKHIKYGNWIEGEGYGNNIETSLKKVIYYEYCDDGYCVIDTLENADNYLGYTASYSYSEEVPVYRYIYTVWSNSCCITGFINTGETEYR